MMNQRRCRARLGACTGARTRVRSDRGVVVISPSMIWSCLIRSRLQCAVATRRGNHRFFDPDPAQDEVAGLVDDPFDVAVIGNAAIFRQESKGHHRGNMLSEPKPVDAAARQWREVASSL